jgi:phosphoglycolate phosphatase
LQAVLFDLDGTLLDTAPDFIRSLNRLRNQEGLPALPDEQIRSQVSNGAKALIELGFNVTEGDPRYDDLRQCLLDDYLCGIADETRLFPGMTELLNWLALRQTPWGIVTNKPLRYTVPLLAQLGLTDHCRIAICPDHVQQRKPDPEGLFLACQRLNVEAAKVCYVGDHERDIEAGRRAGMLTITALWGYIDETQTPTDWGADLAFSTPMELLSWLQKETTRTTIQNEP